MPRVPRYDRQQVSARPIGAPVSNTRFAPRLRPLQVDADNFGGAAGRTLAQVGDSGAELLTRLRHEAQVAEAQAGVAAYNETLAESLRELRGTQGRDTVEAWEVVRAKMEQARQEIGTGLRSPAARAMFEERSHGSYQSALGRGEAYVGQQVEVYKQASHQAHRSSTLRLIREGFDDDKVFEAQVFELEAAARAEVQRQGLGDEAEEEAALQSRAAGVEVRLQAAIEAGNQELASTILATHGDLLGERKGEYAKTVLEMGVASASVAAARQIQAQHPDDPVAQLRAAREIKDQAVQDATMKRLTAERELFERALDDQQRPILGRVRDDVERTRFLDETSADFRRLTPENKARVRRLARVMADKRRALSIEERRLARQRDDESLSALRADVARAMEIGEPLGRVDIDNYDWGTATARNKGREHLSKMASVVEKGRAVGMSDFRKSVAARAHQAGITKDKDVEEFSAHMDAWYADWLEQNDNKAPSISDINKAIGDALLYGETGLWNRNRFRFQVPPEESFEPFPPGEQASPLNVGVEQETAPAAEPAQAARPPKSQRIIELADQGLSREEIKARLDAEGY